MMTAKKTRSKKKKKSTGATAAPPNGDGDKRSEVPEYDVAAVGRVAGRVEIVDVELVSAYFDRADDGPIREGLPSAATPEIGIEVEWSISEEARRLGCLLSFAARFDENAPYQVYARFRLIYKIKGEAPIDSSDAKQFAYWNAVFNGWPYWREFLSDTIHRAQLPHFVVPVMRLPARVAKE